MSQNLRACFGTFGSFPEAAHKGSGSASAFVRALGVSPSHASQRVTSKALYTWLSFESAVGALVGDGTTVGAAVGEVVGEAVGKAVGVLVGTAVGKNVGSAVGEAVGRAVVRVVVTNSSFFN
jgi:phage tail tape-measure protein